MLSLIVEAFKSLLKGAEIIAHALVLLQKRIAKLKAANKAATKRKSYKKKASTEGGDSYSRGRSLTNCESYRTGAEIIGKGLY